MVFIHVGGDAVYIMESQHDKVLVTDVKPSNKSLQATAMGLSALTMTARLNTIIPVQARLSWLCLSSGR